MNLALKILLLAAVVAGCSDRTWNIQINNLKTAAMVPARHCSPRGAAAELFVILAFSGGGMRSAAMSYGLLEALRETRVTIKGREHRLLDEVDVISSVSGGSFTSAYYGLFGERIFEDYESVFLRRNVERELIDRFLDPASAVAMASRHFNRGDLAAAWLDAEVFEGKTYAAMNNTSLPCVIINASDLNTGLTFSFIQQQFDFLCSDISSYPVANAVLASSAIPVVFAPIALRNFRNDCPQRFKQWVESELAKKNHSSRDYAIAQQLEQYLTPDQMPYVRLVDGGVTDNLGIRGSIMSPVLHNGNVLAMDGAFTDTSLDQVTQVLVIIANAQSYSPYTWSLEGREPGVVSTVIASFDAALNLLNTNTVIDARRSFEEWGQLVNARRAPRDAKVRVHFVSLTLNDIEDHDEREWFNAIPTSLTLEDSEIDAMRELPGRLLSRSPEFERFLLTLP